MIRVWGIQYGKKLYWSSALSNDDIEYWRSFVAVFARGCPLFAHTTLLRSIGALTY